MKPEEIEKIVFKTIKDYNLIEKGDTVLVAVSGGKDSMSLLSILHKKYNVDALFIDVGNDVKGNNFGEKSKRLVEEYCENNNIKLRETSFKKELGFTMTEASKILKEETCRNCGILKRYIINKMSRGYSKVATGHNLDDECQSILMNLFKANVRANLSLGPSTGILKNKKFVQRVKPFYFISEKDILRYAIKEEVPFVRGACPLRGETPFRYFLKLKLNELEEEKKFKKIKLNLINSFLTYLKTGEIIKNYSKEIHYCKYCGEPSSSDVCNACRTRIMIKEKLSNN